MKIKIVSLAFIRPDFIELQYNSIKKFVKDTEVEYIVFNNASEDKKQFNEIEGICKKLNIKSIAVKKRNIIFKWLNENVSRKVARSLNYIWKNYLQYEKDILVIIDSDMFFVKDISIETLMNGHDFAFVPAYRGRNFEVLYPWTGLMFFNMNMLPNPQTIKWNTGSVLGNKVDVGGMNHFYLEKYKEKIKILYLEMWNLEDIENNIDGIKTIKCNLNGNIRFVIQITKDNKLIDIKTTDFFISDKKSFPYQKEKEDYYNFIIKNFLAFESYLKNKNTSFPKPFWMDLFRTANTDFTESFIFHYKSGGNWLPFYTEEYNKKKTEELHKLLY
ncbi:MAG: hypothetical protein WC264_02670 [Candidatus Paceibacterota bacterium]|jgi:hypothetical protein